MYFEKCGLLAALLRSAEITTHFLVEMKGTPCNTDRQSSYHTHEPRHTLSSRTHNAASIAQRHQMLTTPPHRRHSAERWKATTTTTRHQTNDLQAMHPEEECLLFASCEPSVAPQKHSYTHAHRPYKDSIVLSPYLPP